MIIYFKSFDAPYVCVFDVEHDQGKLIQFAGIIFKKVGQYLYQICRNINFYVDRDVSDFILNFTGLTRSFLTENGISPEEVPTIFNEFTAGLPVEDILFVSHGVTQDCKVLKENGIDTTQHFCTYQLAKRVLDRSKALRVEDIALDAGLPNDNAHNAYYDALNTAFILSFLLKQGE